MKTERPTILLIVKTTLLLVILINLFGCSRKPPAPFTVTYRVTVVSPLRTEVFISYKDTSDFHVFHTEERLWTKEVTFAPHERRASLLVSLNYTEELDLLFNDQKVIVRGSIIYQGKVVAAETDDDLVLISFLNPNFDKIW